MKVVDQKAAKEALKIAREALTAYLKGGQVPFWRPKNKGLHQKLGCFISLHTKKGYLLRGCIGQFEPDKPLWQVIRETAMAAAVKDPRFPPLTLKELPNITIEISIMSPKRKVGSWRQINLGQHGVVIQQGSRGGTFLPQVAAETGWTLEEFLSQLCTQKAGLPADCYKNPRTRLFIFNIQIVKE